MDGQDLYFIKIKIGKISSNNKAFKNYKMSDLEDIIEIEESRNEQKIYNDETKLVTLIDEKLEEKHRKKAKEILDENFLETVKDWKNLPKEKKEKYPDKLVMIFDNVIKVFFYL